MPVSYSFRGRVVVINCAGDYRPSELQRAWVTAEADPDYPGAPEICIDLRRSTAVLRRRTSELRGLSDWFALRAHKVGNRCALVARPGAQWGLMRMTSAWVGLHGVEARVMTDIDSAVSWLNSLPAKVSAG